MREHYPWVGITLRLRKFALGTMVLGVVLYAIGR